MHDLVAKARSLIYGKAIPITGVSVDEILKPMSLVPTLVRELQCTWEFSSQLTMTV